MKLDKAIEILTIELGAWPHKGTEDWYASVKLGIEALKFFKDLETRGALPTDTRLPGETKD